MKISRQKIEFADGPLTLIQSSNKKTNIILKILYKLINATVSSNGNYNAETETVNFQPQVSCVSCRVTKSKFGP